MTDTDQPIAGSSSTQPHRMRITSGGHISTYVKFAQNFLIENPTRPLVLHTLPAEASSSKDSSKVSEKLQTTLHTCTTSTSRLVSVVEIIKRDYMTSSSVKGKHRATGLWQYTKCGLLPAEGEISDLTRVLSGKTRPKMTHRPYLEITLSTRPLGLEEEPNVTLQYILTGRRRRPRGSRGGGKDDDPAEVLAPGIKRAAESSDQIPKTAKTTSEDK